MCGTHGFRKFRVRTHTLHSDLNFGIIERLIYGRFIMQ